MDILDEFIQPEPEDDSDLLPIIVWLLAIVLWYYILS
jgi:hypothetical protein